MDEPGADALRVLPEALAVGQEFVTFQDFKAALDRWAVAGRFEVRFKKSDRKRNVVGCKDAEDCVFHVRAIWKHPLEKVHPTQLRVKLSLF
jgi:hypothetical protein